MKHKSTDPDLETAKRLRLIRTSKQLSQRQLAKLSGVGSGTISQIESGAMQPSVALLKKILQGAEVSLAYFFSFELEKMDRPFYRHAEHRNIGSGGLSYLLIAAEHSQRKIQMLLETYEPGADSGRTDLSHEGEECAVIIEGQLEVTVNGETATLGPGDAYYFNSTLPHRFRNLSDTNCTVVSACTPPSF